MDDGPLFNRGTDRDSKEFRAAALFCSVTGLALYTFELVGIHGGICELTLRVSGVPGFGAVTIE